MADVGTRSLEERSIGELFGALSQDMGLLVRQEAQLAKTEMQAKLSKLSRDLVSLASGGLVALIGGLAITTAVILLLIDPVGLAPWLAALLVGVVMGLVGGVMLWRGVRDLRRTDPAPRRTVETIRDDIQWAKGQRL